MDIKQELSKIEFNLPTFEELDKYFEISTIDSEKHLLSNIRRKMVDKSQSYAELISSLIMPDTSIANMHESKAFLIEGETLINLYQKLMHLNRASIRLELYVDNKKEAEFINNFIKTWKELIPQIEQVLSKLESVWKNNTKIKEVTGYFG